MKKIKALPCSIFESKRIGNCSNNGISERYDEVLLLMPEGTVEIDLDNMPENAVELVKRKLWNENHYYIRPVKAAPSGGTDYMAGGSYVGSSDKRFREYCGTEILPLHDRTETWREYNSLSN